jgi:hypothetical protein
MLMICVGMEAEYFYEERWTARITLIWLSKLTGARRTTVRAYLALTAANARQAHI